MNSKNITIFVALSVIILVVFFDIDWVLDFGTVSQIETRDPAVEAEFENCYAEKDDAMHRVVFGTIDNPDVQREYISTQRALIREECRSSFPLEIIRVEQETEFNFVDLRPRFW